MREGLSCSIHVEFVASSPRLRPRPNISSLLVVALLASTIFPATQSIRDTRNVADDVSHTLKTVHTAPGIIQQTLVALGGGMGTAIGGTHSKGLSRDLERRMRYQDNAVIILLLVVYLATISLGLSFAFWQASNRSLVTYYADPRFYNAVTEGHDLDNFLDAFSQSPKQVQLQVTGFLPVPEDTDGSIAWQGAYYHVAFTFALDLSLWVVQENAEEVLSADGETPLRLDQSIVGEDLRNLRHFLAYDQNDLAMVEIEKNVAWPGWEELAMNIKHQIRQRGFAGITSIRQSENEHLIVYKNKRWANFLHSRMTKALCALSLIGWLVYLPYMWLRCTKQTVRVCYKIETTISDYWNLISEQLSANGFGVSAVEY